MIIKFKNKMMFNIVTLRQMHSNRNILKEKIMNQIKNSYNKITLLNMIRQQKFFKTKIVQQNYYQNKFF
jgi:hypothetical protein